jgi:hypothetical protein
VRGRHCERAYDVRVTIEPPLLTLRFRSRWWPALRSVQRLTQDRTALDKVVALIVRAKALVADGTTEAPEWIVPTEDGSVGSAPAAGTPPTFGSGTERRRVWGRRTGLPALHLAPRLPRSPAPPLLGLLAPCAMPSLS